MPYLRLMTYDRSTVGRREVNAARKIVAGGVSAKHMITLIIVYITCEQGRILHA